LPLEWMSAPSPVGLATVAVVQQHCGCTRHGLPRQINVPLLA
jgi:hypothetical protein